MSDFSWNVADGPDNNFGMGADWIDLRVLTGVGAFQRSVINAPQAALVLVLA
jgi:hypothetical protein